MKIRSSVVIGLCLALPNALFADFEYQETTKITGGSIVSIMKMASAFSRQARQAGDPVVSTILVKGNRMIRASKDSTEIIDLDKESITRIDNVKHTYTVVTFEQMKQQIEKAQQQAQQAQEKNKESKPEPQAQPSDTQLNFEAHVRNTGAKKQVAGLDADESILTMEMQAKDKSSGQTGAMAITNDMWMASEIPGYAEVRDFDRRFALKMGMVLSGAMSPSVMAMQPGVGQGMADMVKEMSKLKGVPVQQITRIGSTADGKPLPAASEAPLPESNSPAMPSAGDVAQQSATSAIANKLGGLGSAFGGFGHKKKSDPPPQDPPPAQGQSGGNGQAPTASVLIESQTELTGFSSASIDPSRFDVPAGYKLVEAK
jgi:hypothetical protein